MNQIFNFKRFAAYFKFDLASARSNYLLSLLIISFIPLWNESPARRKSAIAPRTPYLTQARFPAFTRSAA